MRATEILMKEHRVIEVMLSCLEREAELGEAGNAVDAEAVSQMVAFFRMFADKCHHGKEEEQLFPMLEARGFPQDAGPTSVMRGEHVEGRQQLAEIEAAAMPGATVDVRRFIKSAREYVNFLREHIRKEDECLFRMADELLRPEDESELLASFDHHEDHEMGPETHGLYLTLARGFAERYGVTDEASLELLKHAGCGCGHSH